MLTPSSPDKFSGYVCINILGNYVGMLTPERFTNVFYVVRSHLLRFATTRYDFSSKVFLFLMGKTFYIKEIPRVLWISTCVCVCVYGQTSGHGVRK